LERSEFMATFSVIVPVYNAEKTIDRCVDSIAASGGEDVQIILVEDCARDRSWERCCALAEKYPNVIALRNEQNRGVSYTRNRGLEVATGEYLLFVDSDDWVETGWSDALLGAVKNNPLWMPVCGFQVEDGSESAKQMRLWAEFNSIEQVNLQQAFDVLDKVLLQQLWTKAFRREIIVEKNIRFDETMCMGEDFRFVLDYLKSAKLLGFCMISKPLYHYSCNTGTLMCNFGFVDREEEYRNLLKLGQLTGDEERTVKSVASLKKNHVYHILRSNLPGREKRRLSREILGAEATMYCIAQRMMILKEWIAAWCRRRNKR